jgi:hypothetical protein
VLVNVDHAGHWPTFRSNSLLPQVLTGSKLGVSATLKRFKTTLVKRFKAQLVKPVVGT